MQFHFEGLAIPDLLLVRAKAFLDDRGFFLETYKSSVFRRHGVAEAFVQDNYSHSVKGVLRGLHYQNHPKAQSKLVIVLSGAIFDVCVDVRSGSPTYGRWVGVRLSAEDFSTLYVPVGFAHGFCVLTEEANVLYKVTQEYAPDYESGIVWDDPDLAISWPVLKPRLSPKDARLPRLKDQRSNFFYQPGASK